MSDPRSGKKLKVLLLCPHLTEKGGVAQYYSLVKKYFAAEQIQADLYHTGMKSGMNGVRGQGLPNHPGPYRTDGASVTV